MDWLGVLLGILIIGVMIWPHDFGWHLRRIRLGWNGEPDQKHKPDPNPPPNPNDNPAWGPKRRAY